MATKTMTKPRTASTKTASRGTSSTKNQAMSNGSSMATDTMTKAGKSASRSNGSSSVTRSSNSSSRGTASATMAGSSNSRSTAASSRSQQAASKAQAGQEFKKFFVDELKDIYWAEKNLAKALPKMKRAATSEELKSAFEKHANETQGHITVVEKVFAALGEKPKTKKCEAMDGLLTEAQSIIKDTDRDTFIRDAGLILAAQKVEHYEIATYGTLRIFAQYLKNKRVQSMLEGILGNEKFTDVSLTKLAESFINDRAAQE